MTRSWLAVLVTLSMSCSVALQDGVRSSGEACSESNFYWVADALVAIGWEVAIAQGTDPNPEVDHIPTGVFGLSSLVGIYKHHNCVRYRAQVEANRPAVCSGGARPIGKQCFCADGMTWNGLTCQGVPIAGSCTGGSYPYGPAHQCACLPGSRWGGGQCVELQCTGGSVAGLDQCECPQGTSWNGAQCVSLAPPETVGASPDQPTQDQPAQDEDSQDQPAEDEPAHDQPTQPQQSAGSSSPAEQPSAPDQPAPPPPRPVTVHRASSPPAQPRAVVYHAMYEPSAGAALQCQIFDQPGGDDATLAHMRACSSWCTGYLASGRRCQCSAGACP